MSDKHDVVIPLGVKSFDNNNFEIKVAVASIKKYFKCLNRIIIVTQIDPIKELGDDIIWIYQDDIYKHDKDANIIEKVRTAIEKVPDLTDDFKGMENGSDPKAYDQLFHFVFKRTGGLRSFVIFL